MVSRWFGAGRLAMAILAFTLAAPPASDARFYFDPNGNATTTSHDIFRGLTTGSTSLFSVRYRISAAQPQVQIQVGSTANATWTAITDAKHRIEVVWQSSGVGGPSPGTLALYVDSVSAQTLITSNTATIGRVQLGSVTSGGVATSEPFDAFAAKRSVSPLIGP